MAGTRCACCFTPFLGPGSIRLYLRTESCEKCCPLVSSHVAEARAGDAHAAAAAALSAEVHVGSDASLGFSLPCYPAHVCCWLACCWPRQRAGLRACRMGWPWCRPWASTREDELGLLRALQTTSGRAGRGPSCQRRRRKAPPPPAWLAARSWNAWGADINESRALDLADLMVDLGLRDAG